MSLPGTAAEAYLTKRGLVIPSNGALRALVDHPYFEKLEGQDGPTEIHRGPALLGAIIGPNGRFAGVHATWIDLGTASGKAEIVHPTTGEVLPAKKVARPCAGRAHSARPVRGADRARDRRGHRDGAVGVAGAQRERVAASGADGVLVRLQPRQYRWQGGGHGEPPQPRC